MTLLAQSPIKPDGRVLPAARRQGDPLEADRAPRDRAAVRRLPGEHRRLHDREALPRDRAAHRPRRDLGASRRWTRRSRPRSSTLAPRLEGAGRRWRPPERTSPSGRSRSGAGERCATSPGRCRPDVAASLVVLGRPGRYATANRHGRSAVAECAASRPDGWFALSNWAKQTDNLQPWQRKLAFDIGVRMKRGARPPPSRPNMACRC